MKPVESLLENKTIHIAILFLLISAVFGNTLSFDFVWDDTNLLIGNKVYENFDLKGMFFSLANRLEYLPVRDFSYSVDYLIWGKNPAGFHLTNVVLYFLNTLLVYFMTIEIASRFFSGGSENHAPFSRGTAFLTAMLFAVHPIHSESVSFITCRNVLLSGLFFFLSSYFFLRFLGSETKGRKFYAASFICFPLALLSKASAIVLPLALTFFLAFNGRERLRRAAYSLIPFYLLAFVAFFVFKNIAESTSAIPVDTPTRFGVLSATSKAVVASQIPYFYLLKFIAPYGLSAEYTTKFATRLASLQAVFAYLALTALACVAYLFRKKAPVALFGLGWFLITLIPFLNLFLTYPVVADRYAYNASYAFSILVSALFMGLLRRGAVKPFLTCLTAVILICSFISFRTNMVWKTEKSLYENTIRISPDNIKALMNLGLVYFRDGNYDKAFPFFEKMKELEPMNTTLEFYKARRAYDLGEYGTALEYLKKAVTINDTVENVHDMNAHFLMGQVYAKLGQNDNALEAYSSVLRSNSVDTDGFKDYARENIKQIRATGRTRIDELRKKSEDNPKDINAKIQLAIKLDATGFYEEALDMYLELVRLGVRNWQIYFNIANIYQKTDRRDEAIENYEKSIALNKDNAKALNSLGLIYKMDKKYDMAIRAFEEAMKKDKGSFYAPLNLALLYYQMGDKENAKRYFRYLEESFPPFKSTASAYIENINKK